MDRTEGALEVFVGEVRAVVCGLAGALGGAVAVAGCVLAADGGATTSDVAGWFCDELATCRPTAVPLAASTASAADPTAAASEA